jgi:PleD family two-component response regulator
MILLDASMPGIDGFECCHEIRKRASEVLRSSCMDDSTQDVPENLLTPCPVLIITALDDTESIDRAFEVGATDYMTKPVNWAVLRQRLHRLINRSY